MKTMSVLFVVCFGVSTVFASTPKGSAEGVDWAKAEKNYIANLHSDNTSGDQHRQSYPPVQTHRGCG